MAETALNFGPDWLRALAHDSTPTSQPATASAAAAPKYRLAEFRYGREEMLALIPKDPDLPEDLKEFPHLVRDKFQVPLALTPVTEEEQRIWARSVNSDAVLRQSGKGGPGSGMGRSGRGGGSVDRGRGRGRGGYYQRGLTYEDTEEGPSTSFSRPKPIERSQSASEKDQRWDDRDRRFDRTFSGRGSEEITTKDPSRGNNEYWRKFEKDEDGDWRTSNPRSSSDKSGGRGSWRSSSDKDKREGFERVSSNRGAGARSGSHQKGNHLPEWSVEEDNEPDIVGTFDSSGAFLETKAAECSLDEIYASDDADEGTLKASPEAKSEVPKKSLKNSPSSPSVKKKSAKSKASNVGEEFVGEKHSPQHVSEPCKSDYEPHTVSSTVDVQQQNVIKQCAISEQCHNVIKQTDYKPVNLPNVPDIVKSTIDKNAILTNARASEASACSVTTEEDAFAHHKKATENMVAQWTEEEEQRVISQTSEGGHSSHQEIEIKWFYEDPQGKVQGPFTSPEMLEWFSAGYFTMSLKVRRECDKKFSHLGELIKSWGRVPFMPGSIPPPVPAAAEASIPNCFNEVLAKPNSVPLIPAPVPAKHDEQLLAFGNQLLQQHLMQQQIMLRQAQLQLLSQLKQQENLSNLTPQQKQLMLQQFAAQQQLPNPNINPMPDPLQLQLLGLGPVPPLVKSDMSLWNATPGSAEIWPGNLNTAQQPGGSIWDVDAQKQSAEESEAEKQKLLSEELEKARKAEEERLQLERELEKKRKLEEQLRKKEEETLRELQKQEEERKKLEEMRKKEERLLEEKRKLEEQLRLEELQRQEEKKKQEELRKLEEQKMLEEMKRQEEKKRIEELKRKEEEQRRQEELRKQEELKKLEERRKKEELQKKLQMEKERELQLELERQRQAQLQREMEEKLQREREREREEMELKRLAEMRKAQGPVWGVQNAQNNAQLSLADIQRLQEEKEREEREEKIRLQLLQQHAAKQVQQNKNGLTWAKRSADSSPAVKSLAEIQQEESDRLAQLQRNQKPQTPAPVANTNVGVWGNPSHLNKITAAPQSWNVASAPPTSGFWDDALNSTQTRKQPSKPNDSAFPALALPLQTAAAGSNKSKNVRAKKDEDVVTKLFSSHRKPTDEFTKWCTDALQTMPSSVDVPTFVAFLKDIESPYEVYDYVKSYLGEGKEPREFAKQFLERRSKYRNQAKQSVSEDNTLWGPAPAITPAVNKPSVQSSIDNDGNSNTKGKTKKRKGRMQKLDSSMLGFTVQSNPDRLNVGEIDHVDGM
ncbi:GRB10-interacting GYF protein 2-like [Uloborus diversus]|uniref:GRB10-interacting GYF protein 2-like n=1 Tax=Uloborus diversus TaxID=327109 RepID=UPI002409CBD2|nr:GRB10-interacting GYF protein 2-like [Uloborus diversus]XP_054709857.1 GRB10-interacting GYF protein 2-like [Uloborus diversus]XP_054709858.1 GRB10-interacting GYF protein 2-like [Uloborus diversus]